MPRVRIGPSVGRPLTKFVAPKQEGVLEYALQEDGTWKEYLSDSILVPIVEITGPDKESIAIYVQELRDKLGFRSTHNIHIRHCRWFGPKKLRLALTASSRDYRPGRVEIGDTVLNIFDDNLYAPEWFATLEPLKPETDA